jgi:hypothetical protein
MWGLIVSYADSLQTLERLLESFLERAVAAKGHRLEVLNGINRLDDMVRASKHGDDITDNLGDWLAEHTSWLKENGLRTADAGRINQMLTEIKGVLSTAATSTPASDKISSEIDRWRESTVSAMPKLVLKRGPEKRGEEAENTIAVFEGVLKRIADIYADLSGGRPHLLSVLNDTLLSAEKQMNKEALLLSALMIYYLKQNGYKVEPFVKRLKEAEGVFRGVKEYA